MMERIALAVVKWLLRFAPDWMLCAESTYGKARYFAERGEAIENQAKELLETSEQLVEENRQLRAAYDALLEEMRELLDG